MITGLNHLTFSVRDVARSVTFYCDVLGADLAAQWDRGAYLELGGVWIALSLGEAAPSQDYTHIAFTCDENGFAALCAAIARAGGRTWSENRSEGASYYFCDPDGHKLELHVGDLNSRLAEMQTTQWAEFSILRAPSGETE